MGRTPRPESPAGIYHVMNQGIRGLEIFCDDADRRRFMSLLLQAVEDCASELLAYCLMGNHFHLLIKGELNAISDVVQRCTGRYARDFNWRHGYSGCLFARRFTSVPITTDAQLIQTSRYIHRNPLDLRFEITGYRWSSYRHYLAPARPIWLHPSMVLELCGGPTQYRSVVEQDQPADKLSISDGFRSVAPGAETQDLIAEVIEIACNYEATGTASRADVRAATMLVALDAVGARSREVAAMLGLASSGAVRTAASRARRRATVDPEFAAVVGEIAGLVELAA